LNRLFFRFSNIGSLEDFKGIPFKSQCITFTGTSKKCVEKEIFEMMHEHGKKICRAKRLGVASLLKNS